MIETIQTQVARRNKPRRGAMAALLLPAAALALFIASSCQQQQPAPSGSAQRVEPSAVARAASAKTSGTPAGAPSASAPLTPGQALLANESRYFRFPPAPASADEKHLAAGRLSCLACHGGTSKWDMHTSTVSISCTDCHGGRGDFEVPASVAALPHTDPRYLDIKQKAHVVKPTYAATWTGPNGQLSSANPNASGAASVLDNQDWIRFVNPGDLRTAGVACGACHGEQVNEVRSSMMTHGSMLWAAALYNNGSINRKNAIFGEFYTVQGKPAMAVVPPDIRPSLNETKYDGWLPIFWPILRWEISEPGNVLRVFERGGKDRPIIGIPNREEESGKPDVKLSTRGFGTEVRTDPVTIGLEKTRLFDPTLSLIGTNDHPGDYRASGCSACHVVYANDRSSVHSTSMWAKYGSLGQTYSLDTTVNSNLRSHAPGKGGNDGKIADAPPDRWKQNGNGSESGHPIMHTMVRNMPTSQCIVCHVHPGTNVLNSYTGYMWWDNETDGKFMYPAHQQNPEGVMQYRANIHNPEAAAARGLWSNLYPNETDHTGHLAGPDFLERTGSPEFNKKLTRMHFADFHGHGWVFRAVYRQDRHGNMLDYAGHVVPPFEQDPNLSKKLAQGADFQSPDITAHPPAGVPVHLKDIHLERGMQCVDCHFEQDAHGNGNLYGETRDAVQIQCEDCHGTTERRANLMSFLRIREGIDNGTNEQRDAFLRDALTGTASRGKSAEKAMKDNTTLVDGAGKHFRIRESDSQFVQVSAVNPKLEWVVPQVVETSDPGSWWTKAVTPAAPATGAVASHAAPAAPDRATLARWAHTVRTDGRTWGTIPTEADIRGHKDLPLAHASSQMSCYACHSSWNTSCFGCHLPQRANMRMPMLHNEDIITRNYTNYNFQTLRDDIYMLGVDATTRDHKIVPIRSACAVIVSSQDANRQWIYTQQQTVSAEGYAGTSFTPYFPHTVRSTETKQCTDCHLSRKNDNNAVMAQLLLQGANAVNFIGRFSWVAMGNGGLEAVAVTEREDPQAVIGSTLHELAYPDNYKKHVARGRELTERYGHEGTVLDLQLRGEYLYAACGSHGFIAYDVANIDDKGFSERIITAPVSPLGQRFYVNSSYATSVCSPSTLALDPGRKRRPENEEGVITPIGDAKKVLRVEPINPLYAYIYVTDRDEGLIVVGNAANSPNGPGVVTLLDGNPENNFLTRARPAWNPDGLLTGARHMDLYGNLAYISCNRGLVVVDLADPLNPKYVTTLSAPDINGPRKVQFQFRYGFVADKDGIKVIDVTDPRRPRVVRTGSRPVVVPLRDARDVYVSRTYAFVAAGAEGLVVLDVERPEQPRRITFTSDFNSAAGINDATAVKVGMTNTSLFAYVADGRNGLKVLQLTSPEYTPTFLGYSPTLSPHLVSWFKTREPAIALSKGLDRDRAVDESGNQLSVFDRRGARPFTLEEMQRLYLGPDHKPYFVDDGPSTKPLAPPAAAAAPPAAAPPAAEPARRPRLPFGRH